MDKRLITFGLTYLIITIIFIGNLPDDESVSLGYGFYFLAFWLVAAIVLAILVLYARINLESTWNKIGLFLSTPIPYWIIFMIWKSLPMNETPDSTWERNINGKRLKEVHYSYSNFKNKRIEYFTSADTVTDEQPFPESEVYFLDSILYYNRSGERTKTEIYKNGKLIKSISFKPK